MQLVNIVIFLISIGQRGKAAANALSPQCDASRLNLPNSTIVSVEHFGPNQTVPLPHLAPSCRSNGVIANATTDLCRIVVNVSTSATSAVRLDAWLPDNWNDRFLATGNGGIGGCIDYRTMQNGAQLGFATLGTNGGHDGQAGFDFFLNQPEVINDFGHRAIHIEAEVGKQLIAQYYNREAKRSYYHGCSTGGRQGLQNAQRYPSDFDGILAGAPGIDWLKIVASKGILARRIGWPDLDSTAYVRPKQWKAIVASQIELFDPMDGITDGVIDNPTQFRFDPAILACGTGVLNDSMCLSPHQVESVRKAYQPLADSTGQIIYPPFELGSDTSVFSENQVNGRPQLTYTVLDDFWRGAVYNNSAWTSHNFTQQDMEFALNTNPGGVNAAEKDLSQYHAKGSKIIAYHGRNDETITSALASEFYTGVQSALNLSIDEMHDFYRLFFIPGGKHCVGGLGAWNIGQALPVDESKIDATHNALLALVNWVENGEAPKTIVGTKYQDDKVTQPILSQRKHCPYPKQSKWNGKTDASLAESWECS